MQPSFTPDDEEDLTLAGRGIGVYVHFPFCLSKCGYCDFHSVATPAAEIPHAEYADAVVAELQRRAADLDGERRLRSVYFGGGTPSLWDARELGRVLEQVQRAFRAVDGVEITVECNPSSFDAERAQALRQCGVNRVSLGVQALDDERLRLLGRLHDAAGGLRAVEQALRAGFGRVSADLMFGLPGQAPAAAVLDAQRLVACGVGHLSAYSLTIEPGTPFGVLASKRLLPVIEEDEVAESFLALDAELERLGLAHYEISNYARPGEQSRHNLGYWLGADYLGLGAGAWGTMTRVGSDAESARRRVRYQNTRSLVTYLGSRHEWANIDPLEGGGPVASVEAIDAMTALRERILLGLRLASGVDLDAAGRALGLDPWTAERLIAIERLERLGRLERAGGALRIPRSAWLLADGTISELM